MLVHEFLQQSAERWPEKTALVCDGERYSYAQLEAMTNRLAHALIDAGIRRGDRVAIYLPNCVEAVAGIFGILKAGGVFVIVNQSTRQDKLAYILHNCQASALLLPGARQALAGALCARTPSLRRIILCGETAAVPAHAVHFDLIQKTAVPQRPSRLTGGALIDRDLACLIYTSGSTGDPKGVMCDHSNVVFAASSIITYLENTPDDVVINVLPLSFDYGLYQLLMTFCFGGTLVLERGFLYPAAVLARMADERVTGFPGVPTIFAILLQMDLSAYDLSALRYITNTAAALPVSHIEALRARFPHVTLYSMYGLTETKRTLYLPPAELDYRPGSVGIAIPGTEVWIEDENGRRLPPGEIGELVVRGRHVMRGYWGDPIATARRFRPGPYPGEQVCHTGDLFRMDADGFCTFIGRQDDIIKSRGEKVAPKEVENVLYALPGVVETAVVGVPDPILGEAIKAYVVGDASLTETAVLAHCRTHLEDFMIPKYIIFTQALPKTSSGKIRKKELV